MTVRELLHRYVCWNMNMVVINILKNGFDRDDKVVINKTLFDRNLIKEEILDAKVYNFRIGANATLIISINTD